MNTGKKWYTAENAGELLSPSLLFYPDRIEENIRRMISTAGSTERLRPHIKTHKTGEIIKMQVRLGIKKFKCATISEAELAAASGAEDLLFAMQPVGPNIQRLMKLKTIFPGTIFSCIADSEGILRELSAVVTSASTNIGVWLDVNVGMNRTGIAPGREAIKLYGLVSSLPGLFPAGLHVYDGHIHEKDPLLRKQICDEGYEPAEKLAEELAAITGKKPAIIAGGTPTFPVHSKREEVELSPGTTLLWDWGYSSTYSDLDYLHAATLLTRVISKPAGDTICLDLGHKAVGSEMPHPRVKIFGLDDCIFTGHNEEHLVIKSPSASSLSTGEALYAIPWHICPTVDRHDKAYIVKDGRVTGQWAIEARRRKLTV